MDVLTKTLRIAAALLLGISGGCSRKAGQITRPSPRTRKRHVKSFWT